MKSEKMSIRGWVSGFYLVRAIRGLRQATNYSKRTLAVAMLFQLVVFGGLLFVQIKIYPEGNRLLGIACFLIVSYLLYSLGLRLTKKRFSQLAPPGIELEAMIEKTMDEIACLDAEEMAMLQDLVDARNEKDFFSQKLEEALRFRKLGELTFLKEIVEMMDKSQANIN